MAYAYNNETGEHIDTVDIADWMGVTGKVPPAFDKETEGCFFREATGDWEVVVFKPDTQKLCDEKLKELKTEADKRGDLLKVGYPDIEQRSWTWQEAEALATKSDINYDDSLLRQLAIDSGEEDYEAFVNKILEKAMKLKDDTEKIVAKMNNYRRELKAIDLEAPDAAEKIASIVWID